MSTQPVGWQEAKTDWTSKDPVGPSDFNRIEGNIRAIEQGNRTLNPDLANPANTGTLRQILSWIVGRIRAVTGGATWYDAPAVTLADAAAHIDAEAPHSGHETPAGAQAKVNALRDGANTWPQRQTFAGGIQDGDSNADVSVVYALQHQAHTRSIKLTYNSGQLTKVEERDGTTVVRTTQLTYSSGRLSKVVETVAGYPSTTMNLTYDSNGNLTDVTRS